VKLLSEKEINEDLRYNFPGLHVSLESLANPKNPFMAKSKEEAIVCYTCGCYIRDFLLKKNFRLSFSSKEFLPVVFNVSEVREIYEIFGESKGVKGLDDLKDIGIIDFKLFGSGQDRKRIAFYVNNFESMKKLLRDYASEKGFLPKKFEEKFEEELGSIRPYVNQISERTFEVYEKAKEWYGKNKCLKGFNFNSKPLSIDLRIEESLLTV
jgi:hypothetical protein